jgi:very-short-patch-repair endonuclease
MEFCDGGRDDGARAGASTGAGGEITNSWGFGPTDAALGELARRQGGHVTRQQMLGLGFSKRTIDYRLSIRRLIAVHHGVYAVGHLPTNPIDRGKGAVLACGPRTALGFSAGGAFWGVFKRWTFPLELVTAADIRPSDLILHRCRTLLRRDIRVVDGLRVTSPARTLLDIAPRLDDKQLTRAVNELRLARRLTLNQLNDIVTRHPRHPSANRLGVILGGSQREPTRSEIENAFQRLVKRYQLPIPQINVHVAGYRVDAYYPDHQLVVETDGWLIHQTRHAFIRDRRQDADILARTGIPTVRLTYDRTTVDHAETAAQLKTILAARAHRPDTTQPNRQ